MSGNLEKEFAELPLVEEWLKISRNCAHQDGFTCTLVNDDCDVLVCVLRKRLKAKNRLKWLAGFLWCYMTISFLLGVATNAGVPLFWVLLIVYPSIVLYLIAKWLWT